MYSVLIMALNDSYYGNLKVFSIQDQVVAAGGNAAGAPVGRGRTAAGHSHPASCNPQPSRDSLKEPQSKTEFINLKSIHFILYINTNYMIHKYNKPYENTTHEIKRHNFYQ